ncbi:homeobox protein BEL1-like protein [Iris pallida]|uniref:Homeobox protein BEL1-like protein n=1 Tax=Iris pallida TaxID=29817 RepID=A0AAX6EKZ9_IRIPA|nr:homeobox protein BEL1-like protein [Iris pallida]
MRPSSRRRRPRSAVGPGEEAYPRLGRIRWVGAVVVMGIG